MTASLSGPFIRPWTRPTLSAPKRWRSSAARSSAAAASIALALLDQRADPIGLAAGGEVAAEAVDRRRRASASLITSVSTGVRPGRHLVDPADVHLAIMGQRQRARDRRRGHRQQMRRALGLFRQQQPLRHAEAVLLVDHDQAEAAGRRHAAWKMAWVPTRMSIDAVGEAHQHRFARPALLAAGEDGDADADRLALRAAASR